MKKRQYVNYGFIDVQRTISSNTHKISSIDYSLKNINKCIDMFDNIDIKSLTMANKNKEKDDFIFDSMDEDVPNKRCYDAVWFFSANTLKNYNLNEGDMFKIKIRDIYYEAGFKINDQDSDPATEDYLYGICNFNVNYDERIE